MSADPVIEAVCYGVDELTVVAGLLGTREFPGANGALAGLEEEAREAALRSARRSLLARGVLAIDDDGTLGIAPPHSLLFRVCLGPEAVLTARHGRPGQTESRFYYCLPSVSVEHSAAVGHVHRLAAFDSSELFLRVLDFVDLAPGRAAEPAEFSTTREAFTRVREALARGDIAGLGDALPAEAAPFVEALEEPASLSYVRCLYRSGPSLLGGELTWFDTGVGGIWLVEPTAGTEAGVRVRRVDSAWVVDELLRYLPGGEPQPAT